MAQTIDTNIKFLNTQRILDATQRSVADFAQRLSSGERVNSAQDDPAGLSIAQRINTELRAMNVAMRNAYDGISLVQSADGGLNEIGNTLQRMRELAIQSANGSKTDEDRLNLQQEFISLNEEIERIAQSTTFNSRRLLDSLGESLDIEISGNAGTDNRLSVSLATLESATLAGELPVSIANYEDAIDAIGRIDATLHDINSLRSGFSAAQQSLENSVRSIQTGLEGQSAARARILDADFAVETANMAGALFQQQASHAIAVQANATPANVAQLIS